MALNSNDGTISQTSPTMLRAAQENDPAAWRRIVDNYSRRIYRWCRQSGVQAEDASDITQEVFQAVARKLVDFHRDQAGDSFRGWLYAITRNKIRDYYSRRPGRFELAFGGTDANKLFADLPEAATWEHTSGSESTGSRAHRGGKLDARLVDRIKSEFSDRDWKLFWLVVVDGQTAKEAGAQFEMTSNAVRLVKMRVLRRFRQIAAEFDVSG